MTEAVRMRWGKLLAYVSLLTSVLTMSGCAWKDVTLLNPGGPVGAAERDLIYFAVAIMMFAVVPVFVLTIGFALKYRRTNAKANYKPDWDGQPGFDLVIWGVPAVIVIIIGAVVWIETHKLDPKDKIANATRQVDVQAISLDWKWVFFYPQEKIVTVNEMAIPVGANVTVHITSDVAMNSFMVQGLGSQIFAMAGMHTELNIKADVPKTYLGRNMQFTGNGFPGQTFAVPALSESDYASWVAKARASQENFDQVAYDKLSKKSKNTPVSYYSGGDFGLFKKVVDKYGLSRGLCKTSDTAGDAVSN